MEDNELRRKQLEKWFKWGLVALGFAVTAPLIFMALKGLVAAIVFLIVGYTTIELAPVFSTWLANKRMQMLVAAVEANPIETMQNLYSEKNAELLRADDNITEFETEIRNFDDQIGTFKEQYPAEAGTYEELSTKMQGNLEDMRREQSVARKELNNFDQQITKAKAIYKMSLAAQSVTRLSRSAEAQVFAKIKEQVAFEAVRTQLNRSFASLNTALQRRDDTRTRPALPEARPVEVINVTPKPPERVLEPRRILKEVE